MPYEVYLDSEKRPQVSVDADRVVKEDGNVVLYKGSDVMASFKQEKVIGYVKMIVQP